MLHKKTIKIDDSLSFEIAALNLEQVDDFTAPLEGDEKFKERGYNAIIGALNNALPQLEPSTIPAPDFPSLWTRERLRREIDLPTYNKLFEEIMMLSGLQIVKAEEKLPNVPAEPGKLVQ